MKKELLKDYSWVISGSQRIKIIKSMNKMKTPKEISTGTGIKFSNVSECLNNLVKRKLVKCLNPKNHLGRLYELTEKGKKILNGLNT